MFYQALHLFIYGGGGGGGGTELMRAFLNAKTPSLTELNFQELNSVSENTDYNRTNPSLPVVHKLSTGGERKECMKTTKGTQPQTESLEATLH